VGIPLKCIQAQLKADMQRVQNYLTRRANGTATEEDKERLIAAIRAARESREGLYSTLSQIFEKVERFEPEVNTSVLSVSGNTPLHYDPRTTEIQQSEEMNTLLCNVCIAEYAARSTDDPVILEKVRQETGLDYSGCYAPMHGAIKKLEEGNSSPLKFWARQLFKDQPEKTQQFNELMEKIDDPEQRGQLISFFKEAFIAAYSVTPHFPEHLLARGF